MPPTVLAENLSLLFTDDTSKGTRQGGESRVAAGRTRVLAFEPRRRLFWQGENG